MEQTVVRIDATLQSVAQTSERIDQNVEMIRAGVEMLTMKRPEEASSRQRFLTDQIAAYKELWERLQDAHIKLRVEAVDLSQFKALLRELNSFTFKQSLFISRADKDLAATYLQALFEFKEALSASDEDDAKEDWATTMPVPREVIASASDLRELDAKVNQYHDLLAKRCLKLINPG